MTNSSQVTNFAEAMKELSGLEFLEHAMERGFPQPNMARNMNFRLATVEDGRVVLDCVPDDRHLNHLGVVHGGWAMTVIDSALGAAVQTKLPAGKVFTTLETKVNMVRAIHPGADTFHCEAHAVHVGGRTGTAEARLLDKHGTIYAHASTTCLVLDA